MRVLIVYDEELARGVVREMLATHPDVEIAAECGDGFEAVKAAAEYRPDLMFLDVQMPKLDGFEVLELIEPGIAVIFTTAYDTYAMRAFEVHAVDYLLKPFGQARFDSALERARARVGQKTAATTELHATARAGNPIERILIKDGPRVHVIPVDKLDYVEAEDDYVRLTSGGRKHLKQQTISSLETCLDPDRFVRIHRSCIVNIERVSKIEPYGKDSRLVILADGTKLPVSRSGYARLKELLRQRG